jgi:prepilin-type N-terminal cleavage/methylation domain-containing protein
MKTSIPGRLAPPAKNSNAGLTLIELMVAMAIVGIIFAVAATSLRTAFNVDLKKSSARLASTLRYLSNKAVTEHKYLRMVYDIDGGTYRVEESGDPFVISREDEETKEKEKKEKAEKQKTANENEPPPPEEKPTFTEAEGPLVRSVKLPSGVKFKDISVSYLKDKKESGEIYTYFFPDGFATATLINLQNDSDEDHYSIELFPLSGMVRVEGEYKESLNEENKK